MTLAEQAAVLLEAFEGRLLKTDDIVRWADGIIEATEKPPAWIIELSTLPSSSVVEFASCLREHADIPMPVRRQVQIIVIANKTGRLELRAVLARLFLAAILEVNGRSRDALDERLADTLVEWDCQDDLDVIEPPLQAKFTALFQEYLTDADEVAALLPWKLEKAQ